MGQLIHKLINHNFMPLLDPFPEIPLGPGTKNSSQLPLLKQLVTKTLFADPVSAHATSCGHAALWLLNNFLEESHEISQEIDSITGAFWHGIMHRREPDPGNAKYWFRQVGNHPVINQLQQFCPQLQYDYTTPFDFVDFCERHSGDGSKEEKIAINVQQLEWQLLFTHPIVNEF